MSVSYDSTDEEVREEFENAADYDLQATEATGIAKAKLYIHAGRILLSRRRDSLAKGDKQIGENLNRLADQLDKAIAWVRGKDIGMGLSTQPDMRRFR